MRLIDADAQKKQIAGMTIANNYPANKASALCDLMDAQPTAYDVDKVVAELEKATAPIYGADGSIMCEKRHIEIDRAIQIVKGGGIDGD